MASAGRVAGSFRDPSGHLFVRDGVLYRQVNESYRTDYDHLVESGLYDALVGAGMLVAHEGAPVGLANDGGAYKVIQPQRVPFISYPYEWCFSELKDAALLTLDIQKKALDHGMSLKDASAYNVQFVQRRPTMIDTLSFEKYKEGLPWVAYRQFCQHFLAPLALMAYSDVRHGSMLRTYIDGVPLDLASKLLPWRTRLKLGLFMHVHLHARAQARHAATAAKPKGKMSLTALRGLIDGLSSTVRSLKWRRGKTEWGGYYDDTNYSQAAMERKREIVSAFLDRTGAASVWDLGANTGEFSRIAASKGAATIAFDIDPVAVETNYVDGGSDDVLPLQLDLTNPSPGVGWANTERMSILERGPADTVMALALIHHLAISNNVPLEHLAEFFAGACQTLIIEFVPKEDSQVQRLLATREDIFPNYDQSGFEAAFAAHFEIEERAEVDGSQRVLYRMTNRNGHPR